jgi:hypothetical protein
MRYFPAQPVLRFFRSSCMAAVLSTVAVFGQLATAQEVNILGLPAIPQPKPGQAPAAAPANSTTAKGKPGATTTAAGLQVQPSRLPIAGELGIQHSAREGVGRIVITTRAAFATAAARETALDTGRLVQRDIATACGKQCRPEKMAAPKILSTGQLEFELSFRPLHQHLQQAQMLALLQGQPMNLTPAQLAAASAAEAPASSASTAGTASTAK